MARKTQSTGSPATLELVWAHEDGFPRSPKRVCTSKRFETWKDEHRQRRTHHKVRTGCLTCKIRRKKCDEAKPECQRCRSTGRVCDGYPSLNVTRATTAQSVNESSPRSSTFDPVSDSDLVVASPFTWPQIHNGSATRKPTMSNHLCRPPNYFAALGPLTDLDRHCFTYFCHRTLPQFTSYFEAIIWRSSTMRGIHHPALFSAIAALGAVHRRFCYGISPEAFEYCAYAENLHKKAIHQLEILKDQDFNGEHSQQDDHVVVVETLLGTFQAFQGNPDAATEHMNTALYHLIRGRPLNLIRTEKRYCSNKSKAGIICKLFLQMYCRLTELLDTPIRTLVKTSDGRPLPPIPSEFQNLEDARDYLFTEVDWFTHTPLRWEELIIRNQALDFHVNRLSQWTHAFERTIANMTRTPRQKRACAFMKLARNSAYVLMFWTLYADAETYLPSSLPDFDDDSDEDEDPILKTAIKIMSEARTRVRSGNANLADIRQMIERLLKYKIICDTDESLKPELPQSQYPYESSEVGVYNVANQITITADHILYRKLANLLPSDHMDVEAPDITCMVEERVLLLRFYTPHPDGIGLWWTQEWWTF